MTALLRFSSGRCRAHRRAATHQRVLLPLEDRPARQAYGIPSGANNVLIINHVKSPGQRFL